MPTRNAWRLVAVAAILIPSAVLAGRWHDRAGRTRRVAELQRLLERSLVEPLKRSQSVLAVNEYEVMSELDRQAGIADLVYLNEYAEVRWSKEPAQMTVDLSKFSEKFPVANALIDAHTAKLPFIQPLSGSPFHAIGIPLVERGHIHGLVYFKATDAALSALLDGGVARFPPAIPRPVRTGTGDVAAGNRQASSQSHLEGWVFFQRGDRKGAAVRWQRAAALDPGNEDAREALRCLDR